MAADKGELRGMVPLPLLQALDAIALARGLDRTALVERLLTADVKQICHEATLVSRMTRGNPLATESSADDNK
jgi:hypothetical protein